MTTIKNNGVGFSSMGDRGLRPDFLGGVQHFPQLLPAVNVRENDRQFLIDIAVPGRKKEDLKVEVDGNIVSISSEAPQQNLSDNSRFARKEFTIGSFKRVFNVPKSVHLEQIAAQYENGILQLALPKKEEAQPKPKRAIEVG